MGVWGGVGVWVCVWGCVGVCLCVCVCVCVWVCVCVCEGVKCLSTHDLVISPLSEYWTVCDRV